MSFASPDPHYEQKVRASFSRQQFMDLIGAKLVQVRPGYCEIHLPYRKDLSQHHGYFHAGVIGTIADNAAGYAAYSLMPANSSVLTVEYKLNLLAPGEGQLLVAQGRVIKPGRTLTVCTSEVFVIKGDQRKLCASSLSTLMCLAGKSEESS